jgi:hypothetical protein
MAKRKRRRQKAIRYRRARRDAKVSAITKKIEKKFGLPSGSVRIMKPRGKRMRGDAKVSKLKEAWNK